MKTCLKYAAVIRGIRSGHPPAEVVHHLAVCEDCRTAATIATSLVGLANTDYQPVTSTLDAQRIWLRSQQQARVRVAARFERWTAMLAATSAVVGVVAVFARALLMGQTLHFPSSLLGPGQSVVPAIGLVLTAAALCLIWLAADEFVPEAGNP